ncbi:MAG TPA: MMPL family transporter, partial [Acidimicrobiales bacterium]|nr:MMPL family transporter [Acidimicrobiales bacterium]
MRTLAGWCVNHRRLVVLIWLAVLVVTVAISQAVGSAYSNSFTFPNTQSADAIKLLQSVAPSRSGDTEEIVFATSGGVTVDNPAVKADITAMIARVESLPHVTTAVSPYSTQGARNISADHKIAFIPVTLNQQASFQSQKEAEKFVDTATTADGAHVKVAVSGQLAELSNKMSFGGTGLGVLLALAVLLFVFGSVYAAILPLLSALFALGTATSIIGLLSHVLKMPDFSSELVLLIGLGVGVDYALFIVTRHRQGLVAGWSPLDSIVNAVNTSGRAVLFAGIIVCIALLGMFALGVSFLYGLSVAAAIGVLLTMVSALTLLPAMLGFIGPKVMSKAQKRNLETNGPRIVGADNKGFWPQWANRVQARPLVSGVAALVVIVVVALPFFSLRLGSADQGSDPVGTTTRTAYDWLAEGFGPGFSGPLQLVSVVHDDAQKDVIASLASDVARQPGVKSV